MQEPDDNEDDWDPRDGLEESLRDTSAKVQDVGVTNELAATTVPQGGSAAPTRGGESKPVLNCLPRNDWQTGYPSDTAVKCFPVGTGCQGCLC